MTNRCEQMRNQIAFYLDQELREVDRAELEAHLAECSACRSLAARERQWVEGIRATRPLHEASPDLRRRVAGILEDGRAPVTAPPEMRRRVGQVIRSTQARPGGRLSRRSLGAGAACVLFLLGFLLFRPHSTPVPAPSEFAAMAVDAHQRYLRDQLPLEIASDSAERISEWFAGKVSFGLKLPSYQESSGQEKLYQLEGARLVGFKKDYAAFVAYRMGDRRITLVVTSNAIAMPGGGEQFVTKGLRFHYDSIQGWKVLTWSDRGLTYALVSDLAERGQQSCLVCHAGTKDRDFIEDLRVSREARNQ